MNPRMLLLLHTLAAGLALAGPAPQLIAVDLDRFWAVWDAHGGKPDAAALN